jgi:2-polyprenyl-3-methyl-5-hydroxy-6-metoxy-1,4-benzoquinol methylase
VVAELDCRWCGSLMRPWLHVPGDWRRPGVQGGYPLYWCDACRYGELQPRPTHEEISDSYAVTYYTHEPEEGAAGSNAAGFWSRLRQQLAWRRDFGRYLTVDAVTAVAPPPARVCELGCGHGGFALELQQAGYRVTGVDPDPKARSAAARKGVVVFVGYAEALPKALEPGPFDIVIMSHVLEHCQDPHRALENVAALLRPGGHLVCEVPNNACAGLALSGPAWHWLDVPRHLNFFTHDSLRLACEDAGLIVESHQYVGYYRQMTEAWILAEQAIWDALHERDDPMPPRPSRWRSWRLFVNTAFARDSTKYDSIRFVARRPA